MAIRNRKPSPAPPEAKVWQVVAGPHEGHVLEPGDLFRYTVCWKGEPVPYYPSGRPLIVTCELVAPPATGREGALWRMRCLVNGWEFLASFAGLQFVSPRALVYGEQDAQRRARAEDILRGAYIRALLDQLSLESVGYA